MADGRRARVEQVARRVNAAVELLDGGMDVIDATRGLARRVRTAATVTGQSISSVVSQAVSEFLERHYGGAG